MTPQENTTAYIVDTHVHLYPIWSDADFFSAAHRNFQQKATELDLKHPIQAIVCFTESKECYRYQQLVEASGRNKIIDGWSVSIINDVSSTLQVESNDKKLTILPGHQVITAEKLELLIIGLYDKPDDGQSVENLISDYSLENLLILPWGVGKWLGQRGLVIDKLLDRHDHSPVYLGDNSGRPNFWHHVPQFNRARQRGIPILPGSDPLPFGKQFQRIGSSGFWWNDTDPIQTPLEKMKRQLAQGTINCYGQSESISGFLINQFRCRTNTQKKAA